HRSGDGESSPTTAAAGDAGASRGGRDAGGRGASRARRPLQSGEGGGDAGSRMGLRPFGFGCRAPAGACYVAARRHLPDGSLVYTPGMAWMGTAQAKAEVQRSTDLFEKCKPFTAAREAIARGVCPYFQPIEESFDTEVVIHGERKIMVGSNNYLGLTHHPYVLEKAQQALHRYGTGCTGSRFLNGTLDMHEELEARLAAFMGQPAALVFSTGYQTNLGLIAALAGRGSVIIQDRLNHASLFDAALL